MQKEKINRCEFYQIVQANYPLTLKKCKGQKSNM
jgi:hypothetical protein